MNRKRSFYERFGGEFYENFWGSVWFPQKHKRLVAIINLNSSKINVLDIGCGTGRLLERLKRKFPLIKIHAIDISKAMVTVVKRKFKRVDARVGSAEDLPWKKNNFDVITNSISFHHYKNPNKALSEAYRVLKPRGKFFLMDINPASKITRFLANFIAKYFIQDGHKSFYTKKEVYEFFQEEGFTNIKQVGAGFISRSVITIGEKPKS